MLIYDTSFFSCEIKKNCKYSSKGNDEGGIDVTANSQQLGRQCSLAVSGVSVKDEGSRFKAHPNLGHVIHLTHPSVCPAAVSDFSRKAKERRESLPSTHHD